MKTPEGYEKDEIKKYLDSIGAWYFCPYMAGFGKSGVPDIVACIGERFVAIEVKREGRRPTMLQMRRMGEITKAGGTTFWGTAEKVIHELKQDLCLANARSMHAWKRSHLSGAEKQADSILNRTGS